MLLVLGLEYLHFPHNDGLIHTFFQIHKQRLFRSLTGTWSATERHFCQRVTLVSSKINGKLLSQYLHNQLDLIIAQFLFNLFHLFYSVVRTCFSRLMQSVAVQGSYMGGVFVGCLFWGWARQCRIVLSLPAWKMLQTYSSAFSDKFGRRPSILIAAVIQVRGFHCKYCEDEEFRENAQKQIDTFRNLLIFRSSSKFFLHAEGISHRLLLEFL